MRWGIGPRGRISGFRLWLTSARVLAAVGVLGATVLWGVPRVGTLLAVAALAVVAMGCGLDDRRAFVRTGLQVVAGLAACTGLLAALGWAGVVVLPAYLLSGWMLWSATAPEEPLTPSPVAADAPETPWERRLEEIEAATVHEMTDAELCAQWQRSFGALTDTVRPERRLAAARVRQLYLDEIERRHPDRLLAWLASGARANASPAAFLDGRRVGNPDLTADLSTDLGADLSADLPDDGTGRSD